MATRPSYVDKEKEPNDRLQILLQTLADGRFHSGERLGQAGGVSRAAVWKLVAQLRELGVAVDAVSGRGYRLPRPVELLDEITLRAELATCGLSQLPVTVLLRCDSTNRLLLERARDGAGPQLLTTEIQYAGRGRWGRQWLAPFGSALSLSLLWHFPPLSQGLAGLGLAIAVNVADALTAEGAPVGLKWPNDILLEGRKLGGILIEVVGEVAGPCAAVIGLGLNLREAAANPAAAEQPLADLESAIGAKAAERNRLAGAIAAAIAAACERFSADGFAPFQARWNHYDVFAGQPVVLHLPDEEVRGIARGVDNNGGLLLERAGKLTTCYSGDLRLRLRRDLTT